jgi:hypothetical protein
MISYPVGWLNLGQAKVFELVQQVEDIYRASASSIVQNS